ncbi:iron ABC transporter permease [Halomonas denitrificans]|uniref:FecCD family ABC transporter permease n=1 Tax=Halomonas TaxID=2745 RepID=UPI001C940A6E|nr:MULTISPECIES: iron ABC transporter permease [Halomonas]MBY5969150.1 iron ABC transporter permease [Halomonas denitrificans]MBY5984778.1 iron ABC transporter permease [Halomonas sp. DP5Y7-2]MBY6209405.1 iron ABC transporter permease [Halomonas sp. DP3Y7-2]MBY6229560.1 iron ABC transporter permease [Halomonas sp. DP3Y7-1]MCA0917380.1 iron ABC transporter permease [Halomonas denitrificans]
MNGARTLSSRTSRRRPLWALLLVGVLALLLAVSVGSVALSPLELWQTLLGHGSPLHHTLVWELRLPRALAAFGTGALLALAGALMQVLLRNPLADPYVLGLSGGASVAALGAMLAGLGAALVSLSAFSGALISILLVFGLAHGSGSWSPARLLLTGVVMASGWGAIITFLLAVSPVEELPGMLYWLMGDMAYARSPWPVLVVAALAGAVLVPLGRTLNVLARGGQQALALGVAVRPLEWGLYLGASLATATAVTTAGAVGFVGLMVPHMLRLRLGADQRLILPASLLAGGALLTLADTLARTLIAPQQLPVGVITALVGVPSFLYLLHRSRG